MTKNSLGNVKRRNLAALFVCMNLVLLPMIFSLVSSVVPSLEIDNVTYEVNDEGNLTIHLAGNIKGVSVASGTFKLIIPDDYNMTMLSDGTPILELFSNGSNIDLTVNGDNFGAIFALRTHNSTLLPKYFRLQINASSFRYSGIIVPQWPAELNNQVAGAGSSVTEGGYPYITSFYAYNSYKGQTEHVKTYIYNPSDYLKYLSYLQYKLNASDYDNWEDWTQIYYEQKYIPDHSTLVVHDYLDPIFTATSSKKYALNTGDYTVTQVLASGSGWSDYDYPNEGFSVSVASGTHPVFVLHLVDQNFRNNHDEDGWFDAVEGQQIKMYDFWFGRLTTLKDEFDINFMSFVLSWSPGTTDLYELFNNKIKVNAGTLIGKSGEWSTRHGTHSSNHGFDMLFGHVFLKNTYSGSIDDYKRAGFAYMFSNFGVLMKAGINGIDVIQKLGTLHESLHTYGCYHITPPLYIMHKTFLSNWTMHADTEETIDDYVYKYDGP